MFSSYVLSIGLPLLSTPCLAEDTGNMVNSRQSHLASKQVEASEETKHPKEGTSKNIATKGLSASLTLQPYVEPRSALLPLVSAKAGSKKWKQEYQDGRRLSRMGQYMGLFGGAAFAVGAFGALASQEYPEVEAAFGVLAVGGGASFLVGAPLTIVGANRSHKALVSAGHAKGSCKACKTAWVAYAVSPVLFPISLPMSYIVGAGQYRVNHRRYKRANAKSKAAPQLRISPFVYAEHKGIALETRW